MKKEALTLSNITKDLRRITLFNLSNVEDRLLCYIIPTTIIAVVVGILLKKLWVGLLIFSVAAYHIFRYVMEYKDYRAKKNAINTVLDRGDISISVEQLSHITEEMIYEPHVRVLGGVGKTKMATFFHFNSGGSWRVPNVYKHYEWSRDYNVSSKGLENISANGDEFFYVSLQGYYDIAYIYPCKFFVLDSDLNSKNDL